MSSRKQARLEAKNFIDSLSVQPYQIQRKLTSRFSRGHFKSKFEKISLADSLVGGTKKEPVFEPNAPIHV